ncbi:MAG: C40 family peptidase [Nocardiaceae bacterium]|nr:C40 family peptidase [Nocardiaceae bacterium]
MRKTTTRVARTALIAGLVSSAVFVPSGVQAATEQAPRAIVQVVPAPPAVPRIPKPAPVSRGQQVASIALTRLGLPYVWGATGPDAFDCSGLVQWSFAQIGVAIPRTSEAQATGGVPVPLDALQPGDVIVYYSDAHHVGLYIGNGQIIHASMEGVPILLADVNSWPIYGAYRYV